jgi:hypothetical protein
MLSPLLIMSCGDFYAYPRFVKVPRHTLPVLRFLSDFIDRNYAKLMLSKEIRMKERRIAAKI